MPPQPIVVFVSCCRQVENHVSSPVPKTVGCGVCRTSTSRRRATFSRVKEGGETNCWKGKILAEVIGSQKVSGAPIGSALRVTSFSAVRAVAQILEDV
jgi:hypothetical protein